MRFISMHTHEFYVTFHCPLRNIRIFYPDKEGKLPLFRIFLGIYNGGPRTAHAQRVIHCRQDRLFAIYREAVILNCPLCQTQCEYKRTNTPRLFLTFYKLHPALPNAFPFIKYFLSNDLLHYPLYRTLTQC